MAQFFCIFYLLIFFLGTLGCFALENARILLAPTFPPERLRQIILPREQWQPFPSYQAPDRFSELPEKIKAGLISQGEQALEGEWAFLPATVFLEYARNGNRSNFEGLTFSRRNRLASLVLAEVVERQDRFLDEIANGIWAICEESFWGVPAHMGAQKAGSGLADPNEQIIDLFAAETASLLAWTHYLLAPALDKISPRINERMGYEVDRRILTPYLNRDDFGWMGFRYRTASGYSRRVNNWNPWINSNVLSSALLVEQNNERRLELINKIMDSLDNFTGPHPADGGCDEGPSYWSRAGASLFDCLELLFSASNGAIDVYDTQLVREIGRYIYRAHVDENYFINFADAPAKVSPDPALVYRYGKAIGDPMMMGFAAYCAKVQKWDQTIRVGRYGSLNRTLSELFTAKEIETTMPIEPLLRDAWFPDIQVMAARSKLGNRGGFFLAAKGGHNDESHNHNDVGNFIVYADGLPVLIDAGAATYTAKTFSRQRYELWNNQSAYHNLPTINGVMQKEGREYEAHSVKYRNNNATASLTLDMAKAYPMEARVAFWQRTITLKRENHIVLQENYRLNEFLAPHTLSLMTSLEPKLLKPGEIKLESGRRIITIRYDSIRFGAKSEKITLSDSRMQGSWGEQLYRILLTSSSRKLEDQYRIEIF